MGRTTDRGARRVGLRRVCRVVATLSNMSERDATKLGLENDERRRWVRLDDAKMNLTLVGDEALWFRRIGVTIANGDEVGVLVPGTPEPPEETTPNEELEAAVIAEIDRAWRIGEPYSVTKQSKRYYGKLLASRLGRSASSVNAAVNALQERGVIEEAEYDTRNKLKGLRVVPFGERRSPDSQSLRKPGGDQ